MILQKCRTSKSVSRSDSFAADRYVFLACRIWTKSTLNLNWIDLALDFSHEGQIWARDRQTRRESEVPILVESVSELESKTQILDVSEVFKHARVEKSYSKSCRSISARKLRLTGSSDVVGKMYWVCSNWTSLSKCRFSEANFLFFQPKKRDLWISVLIRFSRIILNEAL